VTEIGRASKNSENIDLAGRFRSKEHINMYITANTAGAVIDVVQRKGNDVANKPDNELVGGNKPSGRSSSLFLHFLSIFDRWGCSKEIEFQTGNQGLK